MFDIHETIEKIRSAFAEEGRLGAPAFTPKQSRSYECTVPGCTIPAYARGLCNAHYIRNRQGRPMDAPIRNRKAGSTCRECGKALNGKGGFSLCANHYRQRRRKIIQRICIEALGDKCSCCGGKFPDYVYDFHHKCGGAQKELSLANAYEAVSIETFVQEVAKCALLCANCHRIEHHGKRHVQQGIEINLKT